MSRATSKPTPMCCVTIGYRDLLLPADKGMKLVELLTYAIEADKDYMDGDYVYTVESAPDVQYRAVKANRIRVPRSQDPEASSDGGTVLRAIPAPVPRLPR